MSNKLYTKTGDKGQTSLVNGARVSKASARLDAYGTIDELNSFLGLACSHLPSNLSKTKEQIQTIQNILFNLGSRLACNDDKTLNMLPEITLQHVNALETWMDEHSEKLPPLKEFILPGGHAAASTTQCCRTICRRAERLLVALSDEIEPILIEYTNRLSDYLFSVSRYINFNTEHAETTWKK